MLVVDASMNAPLPQGLVYGSILSVEIPVCKGFIADVPAKTEPIIPSAKNSKDSYGELGLNKLFAV
jgi:hypothetical protein